MPIIILVAVALGGYFLYQKNASASDSSGSAATALPTFDINNLPDVDPTEQGGSYATTYDAYFQAAGDEFGIPFALMKAHAIQESSLNSSAFRQEPKGKASYGLMQVLWWKNSNRFAPYGYSDDVIADGSPLYDCTINTRVSAQIMKANFRQFGSLRDAINAYNTGVAESTRQAPYDYVKRVLNYYSILTGKVPS